MTTVLGDNPLVHEAGTPFVDPGVTASDTVDGDITATVSVTGTVDVSAPGTYTLTYHVVNSGSMSASTSRTVAVVDSFNNCAGVEAPCSGHGTCVDEVGGFSCACDDLWRGALCDEPGDGYAVITLVGANPLTVEADASLAFADPGATAVDPYDGDVTALVSVAGAVTRSSPGTYTLVYSVTNSQGQTTEAKRTVRVEDTVDGCASSPCANGFCTDAVNGFSCQCGVLWVGTTCSQPRPGTPSVGLGLGWRMPHALAHALLTFS